MTQELMKIEKKIYPVIEEAKALEIVDEESMTLATEYLSKFNTVLKASEKDRLSLTQPIEDSLTLIRDKYRPLETALKDGVKRLRLGMSAYQTEADRRAKEEADAIAARVGEGRGHFSSDTASRKIDEITRPTESVKTSVGSVRFREDKKLKITDEALIPRKYLVVDERLLLDDLKKGEKVAGAEIEIIKTPINLR